MNTRPFVNRIASITVLVGSVALLTPALADDYARTAAADTKAAPMDTNGDGIISSDEHAAGAKAKFGKIDNNGDGKVTAAEMDAYHATKQQGAMGKEQRMSSADKIRSLDTDNDGALSADEHAAWARSKFTAMDADKDGGVSTSELRADQEKMTTDKPVTSGQTQ